MSLAKLFGLRLKQIRESKGLTQEALAEMCNFNTSYIGMLEIGKRGASFGTIELFAKKLNVNFEDFFNSDDLDIKKSKNEIIQSIYKQIKNLDEKTLEHIKSYINLLKNYRKN